MGSNLLPQAGAGPAQSVHQQSVSQQLSPNNTFSPSLQSPHTPAAADRQTPGTRPPSALMQSSSKQDGTVVSSTANPVSFCYIRSLIKLKCAVLC